MISETGVRPLLVRLTSLLLAMAEAELDFDQRRPLESFECSLLESQKASGSVSKSAICASDFGLGLGFASGLALGLT